MILFAIITSLLFLGTCLACAIFIKVMYPFFNKKDVCVWIEEDTVPKIVTTNERATVSSKSRAISLPLTSEGEISERGEIIEREEEQLIPKIIIQTNATNQIMVGMDTAIKTIQRFNPEYDYLYFNDKECRELIKSHFDTDVLDAYDVLVPGAYKADVFRLCALYVYGGVYLDSGFVAVAPLRELIRKGDTFIAPEDNFNSNRRHSLIHNAMMASTKGNPLIKFILDGIVSGIQQRTYFSGALSITGPIAVGKYFCKYCNIDVLRGNRTYFDGSFRIIQYNGGKRFKRRICDENGRIFFYTKYYTYRREIKGCSSTPYGLLYFLKMVYGEKNKEIPAPVFKENVFSSEKIERLYTPWNNTPIINKLVDVKMRKSALFNSGKQLVQICEKKVSNLEFKAMKTFEDLNPEYDIIRYTFSEIEAAIGKKGETEEDTLILFSRLMKDTLVFSGGCVCIVPIREWVPPLIKVGNTYRDSVKESGFENRIVLYGKYYSSTPQEKILSKSTDLIYSRGYSHFSGVSEYANLPTEKKCSPEFLSGLFLRSDYPVINGKKWFWIRNTSDLNSAGDFGIFADILPMINADKIVVVTTDGDKSPSHYPKNVVERVVNDSRVEAWYCQNCDLSHPKIKPIPIGLNLHSYPKEIFYTSSDKDKTAVSPCAENYFCHQEGIKSYFLSLREMKKEKKIFFDLVTKSHPLRTEVKKMISKNKNFEILTKKKTIPEIHLEYAKSKYLLSVRGNGIDCHRTWEGLLIGCVVIVEDSEMREMYSRFKGIHIIKNWKEVTHPTFLEDLEKKYKDYTPPSLRELQLNAFLDV